MKIIPINNLTPIKYSPAFERSEKTRPIDTFTRTQGGTNTATAYKKVFNPLTNQIEKKAVKINIVEHQLQPNFITYEFFDKKTLIGYTQIQDWSKNKNPQNHPDIDKNPELLADFPQYGIVGKRITIDMLENLKPSLYSGIGEISDQIAVEYCLKNKFPPNIICVADYGAHIHHYKRGREFITLDPNSKKGQNFYEKYQTYDPNQAIKELVEDAPKVRKTHMPPLINFMPKNTIEKYLEKIKSSPILSI